MNESEFSELIDSLAYNLDEAMKDVRPGPSRLYIHLMACTGLVEQIMDHLNRIEIEPENEEPESN